MDKTNPEAVETQSDMDNEVKTGIKDMTDLQDNPVNLTDGVEQTDNLSVERNADVDADANRAGSGENAGDKNSGATAETDMEARYAALNDSYLRLMADFDNFRKRTIREKADLIKSGSAAALSSLLPVVDDFERALNTLQQTDDLAAAVEGVKLIYDKFIGYLSQQGVKVIEAVGQPFDTELFEAIATIPAPDSDKKGKTLDCVQTGYMLYDKVLRHAKVVVGE